MSKAAKPMTIAGEITIPYDYSTGVAGTRFFTELRDNGRIMGTKCAKCGRVMVPPRMFCEECFIDDVEWVEVGKTGVIQTFAESYLDTTGKRLKEPWMLGIIKLDNSDGGLIHYLGEAKPEDLKIGMKVEAVLKPKEEREGNLSDIKYFRPIKE